LGTSLKNEDRLICYGEVAIGQSSVICCSLNFKRRLHDVVCTQTDSRQILTAAPLDSFKSHCKKPTPHALCDEPLTSTKREKLVFSRLFTKGRGGKMLEEVLKLLEKGGGRVADGFQCLLTIDVPSWSDCELEKQLDFDVPDPSDPDEENMVNQERACDAHAREEQDRQKIANLRLKNKRLKRKFKQLEVESNEYLKAPTSAINQMAVELANIKADVDMLTIENVILEEWNGDLAKRNAELTSDTKNRSNECDNLGRQLKDTEEENERLRAEMK
ncbi:hypothetical protein Dimus_001300, partial [Dionaea muscipula]